MWPFRKRLPISRWRIESIMKDDDSGKVKLTYVLSVRLGKKYKALFWSPTREGCFRYMADYEGIKTPAEAEEEARTLAASQPVEYYEGVDSAGAYR